MSSNSLQKILADEKLMKEFASIIFDESDKDGSGTIDKSEIYGLLCKFCDDAQVEYPSQSDVEEIFKSFDNDNSKSMNKQEFFEFIQAVLESLCEKDA